MMNEKSRRFGAAEYVSDIDEVAAHPQIALEESAGDPMPFPAPSG